MSDATTKKLLQLLQPEHPSELRCAAALVLGEVGSRDTGLERSLREALNDPDPSFRLHVLKTIGKLRIESALPQLLARTNEGGAEAEAAAQAIASLGSKGTRALRGMMAEVAPGLRRRLAAALAAGGTASAETAAVDALLDSDSGVVDAATRSLIDKVPSLSHPLRRAMADHVIEMLEPAKGERLPLVSEAALIRVLAALREPRSEKVFWAKLDATHPPEVRSASLQALGTLPIPTERNQLKSLLNCAADADFRVVAPALMILKNVPADGLPLKDWLPLLDAPDSAVRRFALEKVGDKDKPEVAGALLRQLRHRDPSLREEALTRLARLKHGREALAEALLEAPTLDEAWSLVRVQMPFVKEYPASLREKIFARVCAYLKTGDRRADALQALLREADARQLRDQFEEKAQALRKKKDFVQALVYWRLLTRDPACGAGIRFEQTACLLKTSPHNLAADSRAADPCIQQFAGLLHHHGTEVLSFVQKAKWLGPEDLFYLGFHFAEGNGRDKEFGGEVLRLLMRRSPNSKWAKDAKTKLRREGVIS